jgi:hypothetical protein
VRIHKRTAAVVSGLVFGGAAVLTVGSAASASAGTVTAAPHVAVSKAGCRRHRSCGSRHSSSQRVVVVNHNTNISRSSSNQFQGGRERFFRHGRRGCDGLFRGCGFGGGGFGGGFGGFGGGFGDDFDGFGDDWD